MSRLYSCAGGFTLNSGQALKTCKEQKKSTHFIPYSAETVYLSCGGLVCMAHLFFGSPSPLEKHDKAHKSIYLSLKQRLCLGILYLLLKSTPFLPSLLLIPVPQNKQYSTVINISVSLSFYTNFFTHCTLLSATADILIALVNIKNIYGLKKVNSKNSKQCSLCYNKKIYVFY